MTPGATPGVIHTVENFSIRVDSVEAERASTWLREAGSLRGIGADPLSRLDLCVTEALANVIMHGGEGASTSPIHLRLDVQRNAGSGTASVTVSDAGIPFNPLEAPRKARSRKLADADVGGHGLILIARFADALDYSRSDGQNHLTIHVRWNIEAYP